MQVEMLDDDAGLHDRPAVVHQHGKASERPECRKLLCHARFFQMPVGEGASFSQSAISTFWQ